MLYTTTKKEKTLYIIVLILSILAMVGGYIINEQSVLNSPLGTIMIFIGILSVILVIGLYVN